MKTLLSTADSRVNEDCYLQLIEGLMKTLLSTVDSRVNEDSAIYTLKTTGSKY